MSVRQLLSLPPLVPFASDGVKYDDRPAVIRAEDLQARPTFHYPGISPEDLDLVVTATGTEGFCGSDQARQPTDSRRRRGSSEGQAVEA